MATLSLDPSGPHGLCPTPFFQQDKFPSHGGFIPGRFCEPFPSLLGNVSCCLPCPLTDWAYSDSFNERTEVANWLNVAALFGTVFLLLSFIVLPVKFTHSHYLSICLVCGVIFMELAFILPLASKPPQCHNEITPNDMRSNTSCAFSGAFLLFGGWAAAMWVFYRALTLHLQICWEVVPGRRFFYAAQFFGWGIPAAGLALALSLTGVSFRFGNVCHINHARGLGDFWGPLLAFAAISLIIQATTLGYCIQVYIKSLLDDTTTTDTSSALPSYSGSMRTVTARQAYRRIRRVIALQWRGICVVLLIITDVVFFSVVFVTMDSNLQNEKSSGSSAEPWLLCLVLSGGNKNACLSKAGHLVTNEATVVAVLIVLALSGFWCVLFLGRWSMVEGWRELIRTKLFRRNEFVSADARRLSNDPRTYEMLSSSTPQPNLKMPKAALSSPNSSLATPTPFPPSKSLEDGDYFGREARYVSHSLSFSTPRPPSSSQNGREWDPNATHAKGSLPPGIPDDDERDPKEAWVSLQEA